MNKVKALLLILIALLQYRLWYGDGNVRDLKRLNDHITELRLEGEKRRERNAALEAEVVDLKQGLDAVEERARQDLEMIKEGEVFVQVIDPHHEPEFPPTILKEKPAQPAAKAEAAKGVKEGKPHAAAKPHTTESQAAAKAKPAAAKPEKPPTPKAAPPLKKPSAAPKPAAEAKTHKATPTTEPVFDDPPNTDEPD